METSLLETPVGYYRGLAYALARTTGIIRVTSTTWIPDEELYVVLFFSSEIESVYLREGSPLRYLC